VSAARERLIRIDPSLDEEGETRARSDPMRVASFLHGVVKPRPSVAVLFSMQAVFTVPIYLAASSRYKALE
jgi:hypothetical protein